MTPGVQRSFQTGYPFFRNPDAHDNKQQCQSDQYEAACSGIAERGVQLVDEQGEDYRAGCHADSASNKEIAQADV